MTRSLKLSALTLAALVTLGTAPQLVALAHGQTIFRRFTQIASPPGGGFASNGPSDNATFSQDNRRVHYMAWDTAATNLAGNDTNGKRDVILMARNRNGGDVGGTLSLGSVSTSGEQANGDSIKPSLDGETHVAPHCLTFESQATNLDPRDTSPDWDIYLRDLRRNTTELVSVGKTNARNGVVEGRCGLVTFDAGFGVFVRDLKSDTTTKIARGSNPDQQTNGEGVAYERGGQIRYQAYKRMRERSRKRGPDGKLEKGPPTGAPKGSPKVIEVGREVRASEGRRAGNGVSRNPIMDDQGHYVAFESTATNLCIRLCTGISQDRNGATSDIFRRTLDRESAPTDDKMQMVSFSFAAREQGNGPSNNPAMSGAGENIVYDSAATNLRQSAQVAESNMDFNGPARDIYYWNLPRKRGKGNVSRESRPGRGTEGLGYFRHPSTNPSISQRSNYLGFTSSLTGQIGETNGPDTPDMFIRYMGGFAGDLPYTGNE